MNEIPSARSDARAIPPVRHSPDTTPGCGGSSPRIAAAAFLLFLSGCTPICSDCMKIDAMQKKQLDYLPTPPAKQDRTIWTLKDSEPTYKIGAFNGTQSRTLARRSDHENQPFVGPTNTAVFRDWTGMSIGASRSFFMPTERIRRATVQHILEPIQFIEPQTFDPDGSYTI